MFVSGKYISSMLTPPPRWVRATAVAGNSFHWSLPVKGLPTRVRLVTSKLPLRKSKSWEAPWKARSVRRGTVVVCVGVMTSA